MASPEWWYTFLKHAKAVSQTGAPQNSFSNHVKQALHLFHLAVDEPETLNKASRDELNTLLNKADALLKELQHRELQTGHPNRRAFYETFAKSVSAGLAYTRGQLKTTPVESTPMSSGSRGNQSTVKVYQATRLGKTLVDLKRRYNDVMLAKHQERQQKGLKETQADEADRLSSFIQKAGYWLMRFHALEYAADQLKANLSLDEYPLEKKPLPLQFRLEQDTTALTYRLVKASSRNPVPEDISILDVINDCYAIPVFLKEGMKLVDDPEVIRFIRLHSEKDSLLTFKQDQLSQLAQQMYETLLNTVSGINHLFKEVIRMINQTPMQDMELAFSDINPEECRTLLRTKFQSMLPGINERRYRKESEKEPSEQRERTQETMEDYQRELSKLKEQVFGSLKTTLATSFWLRRMLMATLRSNFSQQQKEKEKGQKEKGENKQQSPQYDFSNHLLVGIAVTIGDEDISKFYINPDDVLSSQISVQRADKADKWIAVRKSDKMHRIPKKDFFGVIKHFIENDLNPALSKYGFNEIDLNSQLLPEIHERLADEHRIETIRSGILGAVITNMEEFQESKGFHYMIRRYFKKPGYNNINYPEAEKMSLVARGLVHSSTSILQMKYRRVLRVKEEMKQHIEHLNQELEGDTISPQQSAEYQDDLKKARTLLGILKRIQQIMIFARPSLRDVKLEPDQEFLVIKLGESD